MNSRWVTIKASQTIEPKDKEKQSRLMSVINSCPDNNPEWEIIVQTELKVKGK